MKQILTTLLTAFCLMLQAATIYVDPGSSGTGEDGSMTKPFNSWTDFQLTDGNTYLQKRGTTYRSASQIFLNGKMNVTIGAYGKGVRPVFQYTGSGYAFRLVDSDYCVIQDFEVNGNGNAVALVGAVGSASDYLQYNVLSNLTLSNAHNGNNAGFGIHAFYCESLSLTKVYISNVALDGMYLRNTLHTDIGYCNIYDINRRYFLYTDQAKSSGDGIQMDGYYDGFYLHHTIVQRTNGAGNKFGVILNSAPGVSDNATGLIEYCTFYTDATVTTSLHIERGNGIIVQYNSFMGVTQGIRLGGQFARNTIIRHNLFDNCSRGIGVGATYPGGYPATGTIITDNYFEGIGQYHIWVDKATVKVRGNTHNGKPGSVYQYDYGGGKFITAN